MKLGFIKHGEERDKYKINATVKDIQYVTNRYTRKRQQYKGEKENIKEKIQDYSPQLKDMSFQIEKPTECSVQ